jgi:hypothetical protein
MCHFLRAILFVKGVGASADSYKQDRDESQWWNRRDALVRCVSAFLFGPQQQKQQQSGIRELVLLFDEDWSAMHMTYRAENSPHEQLVPTEQAVIGLWKKASSTASSTVTVCGLSCRLEVQPNDNRLAARMDSKREILEFLQANCSLEFLRKEGLNSSAQVILRKMNMKTLRESWSRWMQQSKPRNSASSDLLEAILASLLKPSVAVIKKVVAVTLHESGVELPCWDTLDPADTTTAAMQVCVILGAVRDLSLTEKRCLRRVCEKSGNIPQIAVRLGSVPEFTSKILSVVAFHSHYGRLGPAVQQMIRKGETRKRPSANMSPSSVDVAVQHLHFICLAPIPSTALTVSLEKRNRVVWCLVRCVVVALWRSRVVGQSCEATTLANRLTFVFSDGVFLDLLQDELVTSLAEQHQAAPSEHQILKALCSMLQAKDADAATSKHLLGDWKTTALSVLQSTMTEDRVKPLCLLHLATPKSEAGIDLARLFYSACVAKPSSRPSAVVALISIQKNILWKEQRQAFCQAATKLDLPVVSASILSSSGTCQDSEAATITMLQHFCYQSRLVGILQPQLRPSRLPKKKRHKAASRRALDRRMDRAASPYPHL